MPTWKRNAQGIKRIYETLSTLSARLGPSIRVSRLSAFQMRFAHPCLAELSKLSDDLAAQRADMLRYKEANRLLKAKEEELRMQLEDELHSSSGWKRERERLESRVGECGVVVSGCGTDRPQPICTMLWKRQPPSRPRPKASTCSTLSSSRICGNAWRRPSCECDDPARDLADTLPRDNASLRIAKQKLETQSSTSFDKNLRTSNFSQDRVVQQLSREKQELAASLEGMNDRINLARQKQARSEAHAAECMQELSKVRQLNAEVDHRNVRGVAHEVCAC